MNVMVTGASGFVGQVLTEQCRVAGDSVLGLGSGGDHETESLPGFERCDVRDKERLLNLISEFRPDIVYHLAAQSYPTVSLEKPRETMDINAGGTINLFECLRTASLKPTVVVACSSAEYGPVAAADLPVREDHALLPLHPYGVSKVAQDLLAYQYFVNYSIPTVRIRIFNTTGPGKIGDVCSDFTKRASEIEMAGGGALLRVGNLEKRRAIMDVRDLVRGLQVAAERCEPGDVYNVGASRTHSIEDLIEMIRIEAEHPFEIEQDPSLMRACDEPVIVGDTTKFHARTGWKQEVDLQGTVKEMLSWWGNRLRSGAPAAL